AKPEEFVVHMYPPGQAPAVIPQEVRVDEANIRGWMSDAGLGGELGNSLVNTLAKAMQQMRAMTPEQRESYKDQENAKMEKLFGPGGPATKLKPVAVMLNELDQKRPGPPGRGLKDLVRLY